MKVLNFGSLNFDYVYDTNHFTLPGETQSSNSYMRNFGGKGLNQSIALSKAGLETYHAGKVGTDGQPFIDYLNQYNVSTKYLIKDDTTVTGHAIIETSHSENRIILHGGANQEITKEDVDSVLSNFSKGDLLLLQNEISSIAYIIDKAKEIGMVIALNAAPMNDKVFTYPLNKIDIFFVNETEGKALAQSESDDYNEIIDSLKEKFPDKEIIMTVGKDGSIYIKDKIIRQKAYKVEAVDTTAAGDTFTGFFLSCKFNNYSIEDSLKIASKASSITVTKKGAAQSIPTIKEVLDSLQ